MNCEKCGHEIVGLAISLSRSLDETLYECPVCHSKVPIVDVIFGDEPCECPPGNHHFSVLTPLPGKQAHICTRCGKCVVITLIEEHPQRGKAT